MQMTPPNPHNALITSGTWLSFLCLRVAKGRAGVVLWATHGWEVTAGSPEQKPLGSARGLFPSYHPQTHRSG